MTLKNAVYRSLNALGLRIQGAKQISVPADLTDLLEGVYVPASSSFRLEKVAEELSLVIHLERPTYVYRQSDNADLRLQYSGMPGLRLSRAGPLERQIGAGLPPMERPAGIPSEGHMVALLGSLFTANYCHWMTEVLGDVYLLRRLGYDLANFRAIAVAGHAEEWQCDALGLLGITEHIDFEGLAKMPTAPSLMPLRHKASNRRVPTWQAEAFRQLIPKESHLESLEQDIDVLYVSRSRASRRRILNEDELVERLINHGATVITLEGRPLVEQISLFRRSKVVIGPHGAGFTNIAFARGGVKLIDIFPTTHAHPYFAILSRQLNVEYRPYWAEAVPNPSADPHDKGCDDIRLSGADINYLIQLATS